jgi:hypothetical protein
MVNFFFESFFRLTLKDNLAFLFFRPKWTRHSQSATLSEVEVWHIDQHRSEMQNMFRILQKEGAGFIKSNSLFKNYCNMESLS